MRSLRRSADPTIALLAHSVSKRTWETSVPRYFFETNDDDDVYRDDMGQELEGPEAARREVLSTLPDMARDKMPNGDHRTFRAMVRDDQGAVIYKATMTLVGEWQQG